MVNPEIRQRCPACGAPMAYETRNDTLEYKGHTRDIRTLGWWCTKCDEAIIAGEPLLASERAFQAFKAEVDGVLSPREVAMIRERLGLSQRAAGERLGGGPRAFQKYEAGTVAVSMPMSNLLRLLAKHPEQLEELPSTRESDAAE